MCPQGPRTFGLGGGSEGRRAYGGGQGVEIRASDPATQ